MSPCVQWIGLLTTSSSPFEVETKMIWNYLEGVLAEGEGYANGHTRS